jgi:cell division septation protein DedD
MLIRALIVLLVALNLGVAAWWAWRPEPLPATTAERTPSGIARLRLLDERLVDGRLVDGRPKPAPARDPMTATTPPPGSEAPAAAPTQASAPTAESQRCYRFGPYADAAAAGAAERALRPLATRLRNRETRSGGRGWRVIVPPLADRAAAEALAARIKAAGFNDYFIVGDGSETNAIALGRFSNETRAEQHAAALRTAGFGARAEPLGEVRSERWIELAAGPGFDPAAARRAASAAQSPEADCAAIR